MIRTYRSFTFVAGTLFLLFLAVLLLPGVSPQDRLPNGIAVPSGFPQPRIATQAYEPAPYLANPPAVIPIQVGRQLFVDDFLIEQTTLTRTAHRPVMYAGNPVL